MAKVGVVVAAAGSGTRMGGQENKVLLNILGIPVLVRSLKQFTKLDWVDEIVIVCRGEDRSQVELLVKEWQLPKIKEIVIGGATRQASVYRGLNALSSSCEWVFIHDAARPLVGEKTLNDIYRGVQVHQAVGVAVPVKDTIKQVDDSLIITDTPDRSCLWAIQTPQAFAYQLIVDAYYQAQIHGWQVTDDCGLVEKLGMPVKLIPGSYTNIKLTTPEDLLFAEAILGNQQESSDRSMIKVGMGYDVHKLESGLPLVLGGITVEHHSGLKGHSDADVVTHALMDALLGAAGLGDIGTHFPDTDSQYLGISSILLLEKVVNMLSSLSYTVNNVDITIACERPKLAPYINQMSAELADKLQISTKDINIKATTTERLGFTGREEGIATFAVVTLLNNS